MINLTKDQAERFVSAFERMALALTDLADSTSDIAGAIEGKKHLDIEIYGLRKIEEAIKMIAEEGITINKKDDEKKR